MSPGALCTAIGAAVCMLTSSGAIAQTVQAGRDLGAPGEEHERLGVMAGTWDASVSFPAGRGRQVEGRATCRATWTMDGRFLRFEYTATFRGRPITIVRYVGFDRHRGRVVEVQLESTHTDVMHAEGTWSPDGRATTTFGQHVDASTGHVVHVRAVTRILNDDAFTLELVYDADGTESKTITLTHVRRSGGAR